MTGENNHNNHPVETTPDDLPFQHQELLKGVRNYLVSNTVDILKLSLLANPDVIPGSYGDHLAGYKWQAFQVDVLHEGQTQALALMLYQAAPSAVARECGFYSQVDFMGMPLLTPIFITGRPSAGWLVLEGINPLRPPQDWQTNDYREAMDNLAGLHDRFWNLAEDLDNFPWLWQPLTAHYQSIREKIIQPALNHLVMDHPHPELLPYTSELLKLEKNLDHVIAPLLVAPMTITHGSYWAGNIARQLDGRQMVMHWHYVALAPAILDAVMFHQSTLSHLNPKMSVEAALDRYRAKLSSLRGVSLIWSDAEWDLQWAHGLMWLFALHWLPRLAELPPLRYAQIHERVERIWLKPVVKALGRIK